MIFNFLKYVSPTWYFNLKPQIDHNYFPNSEDVKAAGYTIAPDPNYITEEARQRDVGYRAFQLGVIFQKKISNKTVWSNQQFPVEDEYRFLRKNFSKIWVVYVLLIRLVSLKNPITEWRGFKNSANAQREDYAGHHVAQPDLKAFNSSLLQVQPKVSVVIPTLNRYPYLKDVFRDLENQTYKNFEVIVVDQTDPFNESVYEGWQLDLRYWYQAEKALWKARNDAIEAATGEYILLYDDDSLVEPDWIEMHIKALDYYNADLSSGVSISTVGAKVPPHYSYFRWSDQLDTGNVLLKKDIFNKIGLFDTTFEKQRMGDGEYGLRAYLAGYRNVSNPRAKRIHLKVGQGGLRQMGSWDGWRPKKFFGPRPVPSILYLFRKYHGNAAARWAILQSLPPSIIPYQFKGNKVLMIVGTLVSMLLLPLLVWQVALSWSKASKMLNQ